MEHIPGAGAPLVVVVGAGLTGMAVASMLAVRGLPVTVVERDVRASFRLPGDPPRLRTGAPQAEHPHTLRAGGRDVLRRSAPAVLSEAYALGARDSILLPGAPAHDKAFISLRRSLLEQAYFTCASRPGGPVIRFGEHVLGLATSGGRVTGVRTRAGTLPAQLVIDATGRMSNLLRGKRPGHIDLRSPLIYTSRPFKLSAEGFAAARNAAADRSDSVPGIVAHARLFFSDWPYATLLVVLRSAPGPRHAPGRQAVLKAYRALQSDPRLGQYLAGAEPLGPVRSIGFGRTRLRLLGDVMELPDGVHQIGDALMAVEPLTSRGMTLGLIMAEALADSVARDYRDHAGHRAAVRRTHRDWLLPHWADGAIRGQYLRPGALLPAEVIEVIAATRRRQRWMRGVFEASSAGPGAPGLRAQLDLATRVERLLAKPADIDPLLASHSRGIHHEPATI